MHSARFRFCWKRSKMCWDKQALGCGCFLFSKEIFGLGFHNSQNAKIEIGSVAKKGS